MNQALMEEFHKLIGKHKKLQERYNNLLCSHEKLIVSYALLETNHEVMITTPSCDEHVLVETFDNLIASKNDELMREFEMLKRELS
jgi:hypothetical protein